MFRYLLLFFVAVLSILRPSHIKPVNATSVTTKMKATSAVALVGFTAIQQVNAGEDCRNAPTGDPKTQCGTNECCSVSEACSGLTNTACPTLDSEINVSCWACCGKQACDGAAHATVGVRSCNGDFSCQRAKYSNIGDHSCRGGYSCFSNHDYYGTIGDNSCNNDNACAFCSDIDNRSTVPSNSCNEAGWEDSDGNWSNICPYCKTNCKIQATGDSCNVSFHFERTYFSFFLHLFEYSLIF